MSRRAAVDAARKHRKPLILEDSDIAVIRARGLADSGITFPMIGDYVPRGYRMIAVHFVDSSGFGMPGEPALTLGEFAALLKPGHGYAVIEAGQFQVYIGEFVYDPEAGRSPVQTRN